MNTDRSGAEDPAREQQWGARRALVLVIALAMALFHLYTAGVRQLPGIQQRTVHLAFALALIFVLFPFTPKSSDLEEGKVSDEQRPLSIVDIFLVLLSFFIGFYVLIDYENISFRTGIPSFPDSLCSFEYPPTHVARKVRRDRSDPPGT